MAKTNISFNDKNYSIDEASLSTASAALKSHLSTVMNGTGATISLDGTAYNIDDTKMYNARNVFATHLGTVAGSDYKVKVGGVEYGVDANKVAGAVTELETVLSNLTSGDGAGSSDVVSLEVKKITSNVFSGGTTYNNETFVILYVYTKPNCTANVTYGNLTKSVTGKDCFNGERQQVFFGTYGGVSDDVETPESGTLTISGDYAAFGMYTYYITDKDTALCSCITKVNSLGKIDYVGNYAFADCDNITTITIPETATSIGNSAFYKCDKLTDVIIPDTVTRIYPFAFHSCASLVDITIPESVTEIGQYAFYGSLTPNGTVRMKSVSPPQLDENTVFDISNMPTIIVPAGCAEIYKAKAYWSEYADYIVEEGVI